MRGEHHQNGGSCSRPVGSSPHARGAPADGPGHVRAGGLIPACAGSTILELVHSVPVPAHPRMRGEHPLRTTRPASSHGSSPHARGALSRIGYDAEWRGLIPACAGSTGVVPQQAVAALAHPRMRGEHWFTSELAYEVWGSSPHARGARPALWPRVTAFGLIPACAGSTSTTRYPTPRSRAHPRMRGEHLYREGSGEMLTGSSPHARGAPPLLRHCVHRGRLIPACAGSTAAHGRFPR